MNKRYLSICIHMALHRPTEQVLSPYAYKWFQETLVKVKK